MKSWVAPPRTAFLVSAWVASHLVACHEDDEAASGKPPQHAERLSVELLAARHHRESEGTSARSVDDEHNEEGVLDTARSIQQRGLALEASGHLDEALRLYQQALKQPGASLEIMERKALVLSWLKRFEESRLSYRLVLDDRRSDESGKRRARRKLAELLAWQSQLDEALTELDTLLDEEPGDCESRLLRGQILEWQGRYPEAKVAYSTILEVDAHHDEARRRLDKLLWVQ